MAINLIDTGATSNDGTGDPIRNAFQTVNSNFDFINGGLFAGTQSSIISAVSVDAGHVVSNTYIYASTYVNANSIVGNTITSNGNLYVSQNGAYIVGNLTVIGNLSVSGSQAASQSQQSSSPILALHYSATPLVVNDGKDIGLEWQYYSTAERKAFFGRQNSTGTLIYQDNITDTANVITAGTFGNVQFGSLLLSNTTAATSNVTGALQIRGGIGVQGNLYVQSNVFVGNNANVANLTVRGYHVGSLNFAGADTIYINGSPVQTAAQAFNGGTIGLQTIFQDSTQSTGVSTGAVRILGGLGVGGNVYLANLFVVGPTSNISGNINTPAQPYITSLGQLTSLTMGGQINAQNIVPLSNQNYSLGTGTSTRWLKVWTYDLDINGTLTGATVNSTGGSHTGNLALTGTNPGLTTTQSTAYLFNETATTVKIGAGGVVNLGSNTQSTSTTTGALQVNGGVSIGGNLYVKGSTGNAAILTGNIQVTGNILPAGANVTYNLGSTTQWWNTFYGVSTQAQYADLAENYVADYPYDYGTVVVFGGEKEITVTNDFADHRVAGVISQNPAYLMNASVDGLPVALRGRVPVKVSGPVNKGDLLVTSTSFGYARSVGSDTGFGIRIFAKSLETDPSNGTKIIEAVII
jgi:hypothetical protein